MSVRQKRETQRSEQAAMAAGPKGSAVGAPKPGAAKPKPGAAKPQAGAAKPKPTAVPKSTITPYLTAADTLDVGDRQAAAQMAESDATLGLITSAADARVRSGDIERGRVRGVSDANNDAASRGLEDSGIRAGNVGMENAAAARGQTGVNNDLAMAGSTANSKIMAARNALARSMQAYVAKAAENGAALPVDPYSNGPAPGANVRGAVTKKKAKPKGKK